MRPYACTILFVSAVSIDDSDKNTNVTLISELKGYDHMPYIPYVYTTSLGRLYEDLTLIISSNSFPKSWPIWTPAPKVIT